MQGTCDATASGSERAEAVAYTPAGPVELCAHHAYQHLQAIEDKGYMIIWRNISVNVMPRLDVNAHGDIPAVEKTASYRKD